MDALTLLEGFDNSLKGLIARPRMKGLFSFMPVNGYRMSGLYCTWNCQTPQNSVVSFCPLPFEVVRRLTQSKGLTNKRYIKTNYYLSENQKNPRNVLTVTTGSMKLNKLILGAYSW